MITRIQITNMGAIASLDLADLPPVVLIEGGNGAGKSSLIAAIQYIGERGHDPDIVHGDAEFGQVILTLTGGDQVMARANRTETTRGWRPEGGRKWTMNRTLIDDICKALAYDPLSFLRLKDADQCAELLRLAPIEVPEEDIIEAIGDAKVEAAGISYPQVLTGLEAIDLTHEFLYKARTPLNTGAETQEAHADVLEQALPPAAPGGKDWESEAARLQAEKATLEKEQGDKLATLRTEFESAKGEANAAGSTDARAIDVAADAKVAEAKTDAQRKIDAINLECQRLVDEANAERRTKMNAGSDKLTAAIDYLRKVANENAAEIKAEYEPRVAAFTSELAVAQERSRAQIQGEATRRAADMARMEAGVKRARAAAITAALGRLKALKLRMAEKLPIPGVSVSGGRIVRDEGGSLVPLRKWNTEGQNRFCLRLAVLANAKAGFVCLDDAEHFEDEKFEGLVATAKKYADKDGLQFIIARVSSGPLVVKGA